MGTISVPINFNKLFFVIIFKHQISNYKLQIIIQKSKIKSQKSKLKVKSF